MRTKDRIKEEIGLYKLLMTIISAISISLIGLLFGNIATPLSPKFVITFLTMPCFSTAAFFFLAKVANTIEDLNYE